MGKDMSTSRLSMSAPKSNGEKNTAKIFAHKFAHTYVKVFTVVTY